MKRIILILTVLLFACSPAEESIQSGTESQDNSGRVNAVKVTGLTISEESITLEEGSTAVLAATVVPANATDKSVQWTSDKPLVAVVEEGRVSAVRAGVAIISVTTSDGGFKAECQVTVTASSSPSVTYDARVSGIGAVLSGKANISSSTMSSDLSMGMMLSESAGMLPTNSLKIAAKDISADYSYSVYFPQLSPETIYYYRSYISENGTDTYGDIKSFNTPLVVETFPAEDVGAKSAMLKGKINLLPEDFDYYQHVNYGFNLNGKEISGQTDDNGYITAVVDNLTPETTYTFFTYANIDKGLADDGQSLSYSGATLSFTTETIPVTEVTINTNHVVLTYDTEKSYFSNTYLTATVHPSDAVHSGITWSVRDHDLLTLFPNSDGSAYISGQSFGETVVTARAGGITAECTVSVEGLKIDMAEPPLLIVGDNMQIEVQYYPLVGITYESSDESIATISETGLINANGKGMCSITATAGKYKSSFDIWVCESSEMEPVDIGLSVMWANMNIGARVPEDRGDYYSWGEITSNEEFNTWKTYKWCNGSSTTLTKYNTDSSYGVVDNKTELDAEDDVAHVTLGGKWRMPSNREMSELHSTRRNTDYRWEKKSINGRSGMLVTYLKNNNSIFFPYSEHNQTVNFWSSNISETKPSYAYLGAFTDLWSESRSWERCSGYSVRPVYGDFVTGIKLNKTSLDLMAGESETLFAIISPHNASNTTVLWTSSNESVAKVEDGRVTAIKAGSVFITATTEDGGYQARCTVTVETETPVLDAYDMGLSVKWANMNLGASVPEGYGDYYAWGETTTGVYSWSSYSWSNGTQYTLTKYNTDTHYGTVDNKTELDAEDDVAHVKLGGEWRIPTKEELQELLYNCSISNTTRNGVPGIMFTSKINGNSIFLPAAGKNVYPTHKGEECCYWSSSLDTSFPTQAYHLTHELGASGWWIKGTNRYYELPIRPVQE